jgi:hypothetical protein
MRASISAAGVWPPLSHLKKGGVPSFAVGGEGLLGEEIVEFLQRRFATQGVVILLGGGSGVELAEEGPQAEGFAGDGVFFDGEGDAEW